MAASLRCLRCSRRGVSLGLTGMEGLELGAAGEGGGGKGRIRVGLGMIEREGGRRTRGGGLVGGGRGFGRR